MKDGNFIQLQNRPKYIVGIMVILLLLLAVFVSLFTLNSLDTTLGLSSKPTTPQDQTQKVRLVASVGGPMDRIIVQDNNAYVSEGATLKIFDTNDPAQPKAMLPLPSEITGMRIHGEYAYLATGKDGLRIVAIQEQDKTLFPFELTSYPTPSACLDVWIHEHNDKPYAYLAVQGEGLHIVDVSDPQNPVQTGLYRTKLEDIRQVQVIQKDEQTLAFIAAGTEGLQLVDVSNPSSPKQAAWTVDVGNDATGVANACVDVQGHATGVMVDDAYAYVAVGNMGICVVDHRVTPSTITKNITVATDSSGAKPYSIVKDNQYIYIASGTAGLKYFPLDDITTETLTEPAITLCSKATPQDVRWVHIDEKKKYLYFADREQGWHSIDISNENPQCYEEDNSNYTYPSFRSAYGLDKRGDIVYVAAGGRGIQHVDVKDVKDTDSPFSLPPLLKNPRGTDKMTKTMYTSYDVNVVNQYVYVAYGEVEINTFLIKDKTKELEWKGYYHTDSGQKSYGVQVDSKKNLVYVSTSRGLLILDGSNPNDKPLELWGNYVSPIAPIYDIEVIEMDETQYLYLAGNGEIEVIRIPKNLKESKPEPIHHLLLGDVTTQTYAIVQSGDHAYVAGGTQGMFILDASNHENPTVASQWTPEGGGDIRSVYIEDQQAFVADYTGEFHVLDISNPLIPTLLVSQDIVGKARDIRFEDGFIYVAAEDGGLQIWQFALDVSIKGPDVTFIGLDTTFQAVVSDTSEVQSLTLIYTWSPEHKEEQTNAKATYNWDDEQNKVIYVKVDKEDKSGIARHTVDVKGCFPVTLTRDATTERPVPINSTSIFEVNTSCDIVNNHPATQYIWEPNPEIGQGETKVQYQWETFDVSKYKSNISDPLYWWKLFGEQKITAKVTLGNASGTDSITIDVHEDRYEQENDDACYSAREMGSNMLIEPHSLHPSDTASGEYDEDWLKLAPSEGITQTYLLDVQTRSKGTAVTYTVQDSCDNSSSLITEEEEGITTFSIPPNGEAYIKFSTEQTSLDDPIVYDVSIMPMILLPDIPIDNNNNTMQLYATTSLPLGEKALIKIVFSEPITQHSDVHVTFDEGKSRSSTKTLESGKQSLTFPYTYTEANVYDVSVQLSDEEISLIEETIQIEVVAPTLNFQTAFGATTPITIKQDTTLPITITVEGVGMDLSSHAKIFLYDNNDNKAHSHQYLFPGNHSILMYLPFMDTGKFSLKALLTTDGYGDGYTDLYDLNNIVSNSIQVIVIPNKVYLPLIIR